MGVAQEQVKISRFQGERVTGLDISGDIVKDIYGIKITKRGSKYTYTRTKIQTRIWDRKMYLYPIAQTELYKNPNLTQNSGWE